MELIFEGRLTSPTHMKEVLQKVLTIDLAGTYVLRISAPEVRHSGRLVFADCAYIVASATRDGLNDGYAAIKVLLRTALGSYAFLKLGENDHLDLIPNLNLPLTRVIETLPNLPDDPRDLFDEKTLLDKIFTKGSDESIPSPVNLDQIPEPALPGQSQPWNAPMARSSESGSPSQRPSVARTRVGMAPAAPQSPPPTPAPPPSPNISSPPQQQQSAPQPPMQVPPPQPPSGPREISDWGQAEAEPPDLFGDAEERQREREREKEREREREREKRAAAAAGNANKTWNAVQSGEKEEQQEAEESTDNDYSEIDAETIRSRAAEEKRNRYTRKSQKPAVRASPVLIVAFLFLLLVGEISSIMSWPKVTAYLKQAVNHSVARGVDSKTHTQLR